MRTAIGDKRVRRSIQSIVLLFILVASLVGSVPAARALVPEGSLPPNTPVSNVEGVLPIPEAAASPVQNGATGTGRLAPT
ncbi:MAG TPA: hypothetical protein VMJ64_15980, partial [Anaerolineales bacterium]|nr:hypothetical protein [Anaerolineales bacterium]